MKFLYANRPSTDDKSLSPKLHTLQASDTGQSKFLIESYIKLRYIKLSRVEILLLGFSQRSY